MWPFTRGYHGVPNSQTNPCQAQKSFDHQPPQLLNRLFVSQVFTRSRCFLRLFSSTWWGLSTVATCWEHAQTPFQVMVLPLKRESLNPVQASCCSEAMWIGAASTLSHLSTWGRIYAADFGQQLPVWQNEMEIGEVHIQFAGNPGLCVSQAESLPRAVKYCQIKALFTKVEPISVSVSAQSLARTSGCRARSLRNVISPM